MVAKCFFVSFCIFLCINMHPWYREPFSFCSDILVNDRKFSKLSNRYYRTIMSNIFFSESCDRFLPTILYLVCKINFFLLNLNVGLKMMPSKSQLCKLSAIYPIFHYGIFNTYSMNTCVLLHFEHKNDVIVIGKLLYRGTSRRRVALSSLIMIVTSFLCLKFSRT